MPKIKKDAVIDTDMLRGFHDIGNLRNPRTATIIPPIRELLEKKSKREGCLTIFLQDFHQRNDPEFEIFPEHCIAGTEETEIINELREFVLLPNSRIIRKTKYSGCYGTRLGLLLKIYNPEKVIVVGVCSDICVLYTVADLRKMEHSVVIPANCVETFDAPGHDAEIVNQIILQHVENILRVKVVSNIDEL